jgi:hypothetical protein
MLFLIIAGASGEAKWNQLPLRNEKNVNSLALGKSSIYAECSGTVYYSFDSAKTWSAWSYDPLGMDPTFTSMLVRGSIMLAIQAGTTIRRSQGSKWLSETQSTGVPANLVGSDTFIFVNSSYGVYRSTDNGAHWNFSPDTGLSDTSVVALGIAGKTLFASTADSGVYASGDNATHWKAASAGLPRDSTGRVVAAGAFFGSEESRFFCLCDSILYRLQSGTQGYSWSAVSRLPTGAKIACAECFAANDGKEYLILGTDRGAFRSANGGATWQSVDSGRIGPALSMGALARRDSVLYAGTGAGVYRSTDNGSSWNAVNTYCNVLSLARGRNVLYAGTPDGVYHSIDSGASWGFDSVSAGENVCFLAALGDSVIACTKKGVKWNIFVSCDTGKAWRQRTWGSITSTFTGMAVLGGCVFVGEDGYSGIHRTCNFGESWTSLEDRIFGGGSYNFSVSLVAASDSCVYINGSYRIYGSPSLTSGGGFYRSCNKGESWTRSDSGLTYGISSFAAFGDTCFAGTFNNGTIIMSSLDRGAHWYEIARPSSLGQISKLITVPGYLVAGTSSGVFVSGNYGKAWQLVNNGLLNKNVTALDADGQYLYAGTPGAGVFKFPINELPKIVSAQRSPEIPAQTAKKPSIDLKGAAFHCASASAVSVELFNIRGERVGVLAQGLFAAGDHSIKFHGVKASPGWYLLRLAIGTSEQHWFPHVIIRR